MIALTAIPEKKNGQKPVVLMPNPFYQVYLGATIMAGAKPVLVPTNRENGFLPDYTSLPKATLDSTALAYFCSPSNHTVISITFSGAGAAKRYFLL